MPALRDYAVNYTATNTDLGFPVATPNYAANDLLVAYVSADSTAQSWFGGDPVPYCWTGWTQNTVFADQTTAANNTTTNDTFIINTAVTTSDCCYFGSNQPFNAVIADVTTQGAYSGAPTWTWQYYNGGWVTLTLTLTGFTYNTATGIRTNAFVVPTDWTTVSPGGAMPTKYWVRINTTVAGTLTTRPQYRQFWVSNWQQLFSTTNTVTQGMIYKIATASEPAEYRIAYSAAETANALLMAVRDIDTTIPFATTIASGAAGASYLVTDSDQALGNGTTTGVAQSYTAIVGYLASLRFNLKKNAGGSPTGTAVAKLYTHSGTFGSSSVPTGVALATSNTYNVSLLTESYQLIEFTFPWRYNMTAANYCVAIEYSGGDASNYVQVGYDAASGAAHSGNKSTYAGSWSAQANDDVHFAAPQFTFTTGTASTSKFNLPTMTTSRNNSLMLYGVANSTVVVPNIIEGPCTLIVGKDGATHSDACSWGFQATAGTTPAGVGASNMGATSGLLITTAVVGVNPPSTGATVIPGYCSADASIYLTPISGITAFNGDTAFTADITTYFGATLNGQTLSNGTAAAIADYGLNSYHSMGRLTGVVTSGTWAGATNVFLAAKTTIADKNILCHAVVNTPVEIQTTDSVTLTGTMGVAFGLCTTANAHYKVWHVAGAGTTWDVNRTPIVINTGNTNFIQNTGSFDPASIKALGFMVSGKVAAPDWDFGSAWALDTVTIAGGNAAEPLDIPQIVKTSATGHERMSAIQQGAKQMLLLGPLQIGDGGTNPVYLGLDSTAIEFPRQYNKAAKEVYYCSTDNIAGVTYYAGKSDTISHKNSIVSSPSRYHWKLHASSFANFATTTRARSSNVATIGTISAHGLSASNSVLVSSVGGTGYNGTWTVVSVPDSTHFTYANTENNETEIADTGGIIGPKYDFSGLSVIGAGTISLARAITITNLTINDYSTLDVSGLTFTGGTIKNMPATNNSVTTSSTTLIQTSTITVTTVTAGNRWCSVALADLDIFANNTFIGSSTSGHAIHISSAGTIAFTGNTFTSFGPAARFFNTSSSGINDSTDVITLDAAHGYTNGDPAYYQDQGGSQNVGLTDGNLYYVRSESSTTITLYDTAAHAIAGGTTGRANLTAAGSETHYIYSAGAAIYNTGGAVTINLSGGTVPSIRNSDGSSTTVNNSVNLEINGVTYNARCRIEKQSDATALLSDYAVTSDGAGKFKATASYNYPGSPVAVNIIVRQVGYLPFLTTGTITSSGLTVTAVWQSDSISDKVDAS